MDKLIEFARKAPTETLIKAVKECGGKTKEHIMSRAAMIAVIEERNGKKFADALMDEIGL